MNNKRDETDHPPSSGSDGPKRSANRPPAARISPGDMEHGRDEMNIVEFPLAGLSNRSPEGRGTLVFEDRTWDRQQRAHVRKRLTVAASAEFGLPTASDDEVILGLLQLTKVGQFTDRTIAFVPAELLRLLGWREEGRNYARLEKSLRRWIGVTLYYDHAWWDKQRQAWVNEHFHLLENVTVRRSRGKSGAPRRRPWSVTWNETVFRSFQAGYLKRLDMGLYRRLRLAAAKRMYRFLDKRFYFENRLVFDLRTFACEHIGFNRRDDNSQLKRRLDRAVDELERVEYLEPLPREARYRKLCRGRWEVRFLRRHAPPGGHRTRRPIDTREAALVKRGVRQPVAVRLVREHPAAAVTAALAHFDEMVRRGRDSSLANPPGLLVALIRERSESTATPDRAADTDSVKPCPQTPRRHAAIRKRQAEREAAACRQHKAIRGYLDKLTAEERKLLEEDALSQANPFQQRCYYRSHEDGNAQLLREYREIIVVDHVRRLLGISPG